LKNKTKEAKTEKINKEKIKLIISLFIEFMPSFLFSDTTIDIERRRNKKVKAKIKPTKLDIFMSLSKKDTKLQKAHKNENKTISIGNF
tara:strand:- start:664 stop:927 length:264 start_codon:yes stop_codon:yes gene_type:complete